MPEKLGIFEYILRLLFPPKCIFCEALLSIGTNPEICQSCYSKMPLHDSDYLSPGVETTVLKGCDRVVSLFRYSGIVRETLLRYKFNDRPSYFRTLSLLLYEKLIKVTKNDTFDIIVSVPLHKKRELSRGYNQARLISECVAKKLGKPDCSRMIKRKRETAVQSTLTHEERIENVREAFYVLNPSIFNGKKVLLIDDILTTGNTIGECGRLIKEAGAAEVIGAVLATGRMD